MQPIDAVPAAAFAAFQGLMLEEPVAFAQLQAESDPGAFAALAVRCGAERGLAFGVEDVQAALRLEREGEEAQSTRAADLAGWTPVRLFWADGQPRIDWYRLGPTAFTEPFFEQTIARAMRHPAQRLFRRQTPAAVLAELGECRSGLRPTGFIFHESRCGSTLVAQMLAALPRNVVISEAPPLDQVLLAHLRDPRITREQRLAWFRGMVGALGQPRRGDEQRYFIKFDCWHTLELALIREAFPEVPWIFLYRDPVEVLVSHHRRRGPQVIPGMLDSRVHGVDFTSIANMSFDEYGAQVLARICRAALQHAERDPGRFVNFAQLPGVLWASLGETFGVDWTPDEVALMQCASRADAKTPSLPHADDRADKQRAATSAIRRLAAAWMDEVYAELEAARQAGQETTGPGKTAAETALTR